MKGKKMTQTNAQTLSNEDDVLDLGELESSGGSGNFAKITGIPEGTTSYRFITNPVKGKKHLAQHWLYWFSFDQQQEDGSVKTIKRSGKAEFGGKDHVNPVRARLLDVLNQKDALTAPYVKNVQNERGEIVPKLDRSAMPTEVEAEYKKLTQLEMQYKASGYFYVNAVDSNGNLVALRLSKTVKEQIFGGGRDNKSGLIHTLVGQGYKNPMRLTDGEGLLEKGVWFEITRTGKGLQTKYTSKIKTVDAGNGSFRYDTGPIKGEVIANYSQAGSDVEDLFVTFNDQELEQILAGDITVVDNKLKARSGNSETNTTTVTDVNPTASTPSTTTPENVNTTVGNSTTKTPNLQTVATTPVEAEESDVPTIELE